MAETLLEKPICQSCNADVRPGALFCYNCGSKVVKAESLVNNGKVNSAIRQPSGGEILPEPGRKFGFEERPIEKPTAAPFALDSEKKGEIEAKAAVPARSQEGLKSAPPMRKRTRLNPAEKKNIEIVWEPAEQSPNFLFILVSLFLLLVAIGILAVMLYIR